MRSLGIDIGRYSIKVVEVVGNNRTYEITRAKEYKILNIESSDQEIDIIQTLSEIAKEFDTDNAKVSCSIRQQYVSTRKLFFPFKERAKIHKSLAFELEDDMPLSVDKAVYDSKIIKFHAKAAEVIAMACVSEEIARTLEIFESGHIDPDIITPEICAVSNLYEKWDRSPEEVKAQKESTEEDIEDEKTKVQSLDKMVVHIGYSKTFVGVVRDEHLIWGRSIMWGAEKIAGAISQNFQVPFSVAHDMMPEKAFVLLTAGDASKEQIKMSDSLTQALEPLIQSLRLTIMLANTEYGANVSNIEIIGSPSKIKNLAPYFTQELERSTNYVNPIQNLRGQNIKNLDQLNDSFQMALGLTIEGLRRPSNPPVNFRQDEFAKKNVSFEKFWERWNYSIKVVAAAYICYFIYAVAIDSISTQLEEASNDVLSNQASKIAKLEGRKATHSKIKAYITRNNKKAKLVEVYDEINEINTPMKFINEISQILPSNKKDKSYEVRRFVINNTEVDIQGVAKDAKTVERLKKALKRVATGGKLTVAQANIPKEENKTPFAFKFEVKRKN